MQQQQPSMVVETDKKHSTMVENNSNNNRNRNTSNSSKHSDNNDREPNHSINDQSNNSNNNQCDNSSNNLSNNSNINDSNNVNKDCKNFYRRLEGLKFKMDNFVHYHHMEHYLTAHRFHAIAWTADSPPKADKKQKRTYPPLTTEEVDDISFGDVARGIIAEQALCLSRGGKKFKKYVDELYLESVSYFKTYHKTNWSKNWKGVIESNATKYRKIVAIVFMRILIADTLQTNKIFVKKQDTLLDDVVDEVNRVKVEINRGAIANIHYQIYKMRLGFKRWCAARGGVDAKLKKNIRLDNGESMVNGILRYECEQCIQERFVEIEQKYELLKQELESYKKKISERSGRGGKYTYEYAMALTRVFQKMGTTEQKTIDGINQALNLLPQSMHANQIIPKIPCRQTCACFDKNVY